MHNSNTAYVIGVALGDGNLSNPNGRAVRLRITCDTKYPLLIERIKQSLIILFPKNKVSIFSRKENCVDISCYSNQLESILGWKAKSGSKYTQKVHIPKWIMLDKNLIKVCLKGLFETDGSIYKDRSYTYVNFTTIIPNLAYDVQTMLKILEYKHSTQRVIENKKKPKFVIRIAKNSQKFIEEINLDKN